MSSSNPQRNPVVDTPEQIERRRIVEQFLLFQESLPKVNALSYQWLLNEMVPMSMAVENNLSQLDENSSVSSQSVEPTSDEINEEIHKLSLNKLEYVPSHKLIAQLCHACLLYTSRCV